MARRYYTPDAGLQMAAQLGLPPEHRSSLAAPPLEVWECHWDDMLLFVAMASQWRIGMNGATGLDYNALPLVARYKGIRLTPERFEAVQVMENEALLVFGERNERNG